MKAGRNRKNTQKKRLTVFHNHIGGNCVSAAILRMYNVEESKKVTSGYST
jgi:hypothetical protein